MLETGQRSPLLWRQGTAMRVKLSKNGVATHKILCERRTDFV